VEQEGTVYLVLSEEIPMGGCVVALANYHKITPEGEGVVEGVETIFIGSGDLTSHWGARGVALSLTKQGQDVYFIINNLDDPEIFGFDANDDEEGEE